MTPPSLDPQAPLLRRQDGGIVHLRFNRPAALNSIDLAMASAFHQACRELAQDDSVRVVVLGGEGRAFMAGGDLPSMQADPVGGSTALIAQMHPALEILAGLRAPVIASVHGAVAGAGLGVALAADLVIAAQGTRFSLAYPRIGTSPDCSTSWGLVRWVGMRKAMEIALLSDSLDADEALRIQLVNRVVPADELAAQTQAAAQRIAQGAPIALGHLKALLRQAGGNDLRTHLALEARLFRECAGTEDFVEGMASFMAKRPAKFLGR
ncbi:MAG: enoyl-CoA hydratase [Betaproteobacteria bacterium]|nr:enoyl-CoA hydratase [Betaproteobacteria bacterium]